MPKKPRNVGASVRAKLLRLAKEQNRPFELLLTRYVLERFLYRLSITRQRDRFVLKGAMLIASLLGEPHRPTRDLDLLGYGDPNPEAVLAAFREICAAAADDAVVFDIHDLSVDRIRDEQEYGGLRIKTTATVDGARVRLVVDVGFGDATEPGLAEIELPVLLGLPAPRLRAYARETVIAEKFQAMVMLGRANSRMKDLYDVWLLSRAAPFRGDRLAGAIAATFERRKTAIPAEPPDALTSAFAEDATKQRQWAAFMASVGGEPVDLAQVLDELSGFLMRHAAKAQTLKRS